MYPNHLISRKTFIDGAFGAGCFIATATLMPRVSEAQMDKVKLSMTALQAKTAKLGEPRIEGIPLPAKMCRPCISARPR